MSAPSQAAGAHHDASHDVSKFQIYVQIAMILAVITGIGFLGAGLIIFRGDTLHGITTAAGLWIVSGIGMAVGFGMYAVSIFATFLALLMFTGMWYVENRFKHWFEEVKHDATSPNS